MAHFAGLHVSVNKTSVGIVEDTSRIMREVKAPVNLTLSCRCCGLRLPFQANWTGSSATCGNGYSALSPKPS